MMSYIHIAYNPKKVTCLEKGENISERKDNKSPQHKTMPISILWKYAILTLVSAPYPLSYYVSLVYVMPWLLDIDVR